MNIQPTGDRLKWHVSSESGEKDGYVIDMDALHGNGHCLCRDFQCRCEPNFVKNHHQIVDFGLVGRTRCKHIHAIVLHLGQLVIDKARSTMGRTQ